MVIDNQMVEMKWHPRNKQYYTDLGYIYTKKGDKFEVKVEHLTKGAKSLVDVRCDYCGKIIKVKYQNYINRYSPTLKDACTQCKTKKAIDSNLNRYGVSNVFELEDIKSKSKNTFLEKYDFSGKKIVLFATSGGSGFGNTVSELKPSAPDAEIVEGKVLNKATKQEIAEWIKSIS